MKIFCICVLCFVFAELCSLKASDERLIIGKIVDSEDQSPVPGATVRLVTTNKGTYTNREGKFRLTVPLGKQILRVSSLGYESVKINLSDKNDTLVIKLKPSAVSVKGVEVTGNITAQQVIARSISKKRENLAKIKTFTGLLYSKLSLEIGGSMISSSSAGSNSISIGLPFGLGGEQDSTNQLDRFKLYVMETFSRNSIDFENKVNHSNIIQRRQTANIPPQGNLLSLGNFQSFYEDRINIVNADFATPLASDALDFYDFKFINKTMIDDRYVYNISVLPKTKTYPAFYGTIKIIEGTYNLIEVNLSPSENSSISFVEDLAFVQKFEEVKSEIWYPTYLEVSAVAKVDVVKGFADIGADFKAVSIYSEMTINEKLADSLYQKTVPRISVAETADSYESKFWEQNSLREISEKELDMYKKVEIATAQSDSIEAKRKARMFDLDYYFDFNRVGAISLGSLPSFSYKDFSLTGKYSYSFGQKRSFGEIASSFAFKFNSNSELSARANVFSSKSELGNNQSYSRFLNSILSALGHDDYYDYFQKDGFSAGLDFSYKNLTLWAEYESSRQFSLKKTTNRTIFSKKRMRDNPPINEGNYNVISAGGGFSNGESINLGGRFVYNFEMISYYGENRSSESMFRAVEAKAKLSIPTFKTGYLRMSLDIGLQGGLASKSQPAQNLFVLNSTMLFIAAEESFVTAPTCNIGGNEYFAAHLNFNTRDLFWRALRLPLYQRRGIELIFGGSIAKFNNLTDSKYLVPSGKEPYSEAGFGLGRIPTFFNNIFFLETNFRWGIGGLSKNRFGWNIKLSSPL